MTLQPLAPLQVAPSVADRLARAKQSELARLLGVSYSLIWQWRRDYGFPEPEQVRGVLLFRLLEVEAWLKENATRVRAQIPARLAEVLAEGRRAAARDRRRPRPEERDR